MLPDAPGGNRVVGPALAPAVEPACVTPLTFSAFAGPDAGMLDAGLFVILPKGGREDGGIADSFKKGLSYSLNVYSVLLVRGVLTLS